MSSKNKKHKIGKKERIDITIALVVILLFIAFAFHLVQGEAINAPIIDNKADRAEIIDDRLSNLPLEIEKERVVMVVNGSHYELDQNTSEMVDLSYHYLAADSLVMGDAEANSKDDELTDIDSSLTVYATDSMSFFKEDESIDYAAVESDQSIDAASDVITTNVSLPQKEVAQKEKIQEQSDCIIVIGVFGNPINVKRLQRRLDQAGYDHFTSPFKNLTRIAIRVSCAESQYIPILKEIRSDYAQDAVLLKS